MPEENVETVRRIYRTWDEDPAEVLEFLGAVDLDKYEPHVWSFREGKVIRFEWFNDRDEAMTAAGLRD